MLCLYILVDTPDHQSFCSMSMDLYGRKIGTFFYHVILMLTYFISIKISRIYNIFWVKLSMYTTLEQPDFSYISKIWFQDSVPAQPEIFLDNMIVHYTRTTWLSRNLYNLISAFYTCTTCNLDLYGKVTYFTLYSHSLIFITFAKHYFRSFFIIVVCMFSYIYIFRNYTYV